MRRSSSCSGTRCAAPAGRRTRRQATARRTRTNHNPPTDRRSLTDNVSVRPLLKWAGGKRQLLPALEQYYPPSFERYLEPFLGSGAVFFHLAATGVLDGRTVRLSDVNTDLIGCYRMVRDRTDAV